MPKKAKNSDNASVILPPSLPEKITCAEYEKLRRSEITIEDIEAYDQMVAMAEKDPEFVEMVFFELVRIAPYEWLNTRLIDGYEKLKEEKQKQAQYDDTPKKIKILRAIREKSIGDGRVKIGKIDACKEVPIDHKTAKIHAPDLWENWNNPDYK